MMSNDEVVFTVTSITYINTHLNILKDSVSSPGEPWENAVIVPKAYAISFRGVTILNLVAVVMETWKEVSL